MAARDPKPPVAKVARYVKNRRIADLRRRPRQGQLGVSVPVIAGCDVHARGQQKKGGAFRPVLGSLEAKFHADEAVAHRPPNSIATFGHASVTPAERYGTYSPNLPSQPINVIPRLNSATACVGSAPRLVSIIENHLLDVGFRDARLDFGKQILSNRTFLKRTNERNHIA